MAAYEQGSSCRDLPGRSFSSKRLFRYQASSRNRLSPAHQAVLIGMDVIVFGEIGQVALDMVFASIPVFGPSLTKFRKVNPSGRQCIKGDFFHHVQRRHSHVVAIFSGILTKPNPCAGLGKHRDPFGLPARSSGRKASKIRRIPSAPR